ESGLRSRCGRWRSLGPRPPRLEGMTEVFGPGALDHERHAGDRVRKGQARGVKHEARDGRSGWRELGTVEGVAEDRHPRSRQVNANLVLATGTRAGLYQQGSLANRDQAELRGR